MHKSIYADDQTFDNPAGYIVERGSIAAPPLFIFCRKIVSSKYQID